MTSSTPPQAPPHGSFASLGLAPELLQAVLRAGYERPTEVQVAAIPAVLAGRDVLARAHTGSGKTAAFGLPLLQRLGVARVQSGRGNHARMLVLAPTRELATQLGDALESFSIGLSPRPRVLSVVGGMSLSAQMMALRGGVDILVATPGRLLDLRRQNAVRLDQTEVLVLDEADRMLGLGFADELAELLGMLPPRRQTLLFSATIPEELAVLAQSHLHNPVEVQLAPAAGPEIEEQVFSCSASKKNALLAHLIEERALQHVLVFVSVKRSGDVLARELNRAGIQAAVFHADKSQTERTRCLSDFRAGKLRVLVASDLAARGIDIDDLPTVVNLELPRSPNDYVHRIGRTGRAGKVGTAITLLCPTEYAHFRVIEKRIKRRLPRQQVPGFEA